MNLRFELQVREPPVRAIRIAGSNLFQQSGSFLARTDAGVRRFVVEPPNLLSEMNLLNCRFFRQLVRRFGSRFGEPLHIESELPSSRFAGSRNLFEPLSRKRQLQVFKASLKA